MAQAHNERDLTVLQLSAAIPHLAAYTLQNPEDAEGWARLGMVSACHGVRSIHAK